MSQDAQRLLADLDGLRRSTRGRRQAYWFPLVLFGLLLCGAAPLFVRMAAPCEGSCYVAATGPGWLRGFGDGVLGVYWLCALLVGTVLTTLWYAWHARDSGLRTRVRGPVLAWLLGIVVLLGAATVAASLSVVLWPALVRQDAALLVVAVGLLVLARLERSRYLLVVAVVVAGLAVLATYYNPENLLFRLLHLFGVADASMPFRFAGAFGVLLPGAVLLAAGVAALAGDARRR
ncbi:MAG TPA: hypothetical protein VFS29_09865 [Motilibacteraceae bacterium]|nr:hypothetical protein [Motilibacteraceae bacterium]